MGFLAATPFLVKSLSGPFGGITADLFRRRGLSTKSVRRLYFAIGKQKVFFLFLKIVSILKIYLLKIFMKILSSNSLPLWTLCSFILDHGTLILFASPNQRLFWILQQLPVGETSAIFAGQIFVESFVRFPTLIIQSKNCESTRKYSERF